MANPITRTPQQGNIISRFFGGMFRRSASPTQTVGTTGTQVVGGFIQENEQNAKLQGMQRHITFSDMLANVSIVGAGVRLYLNLVANAGWTFDAADSEDLTEAEKALATEYATKVEEMSNQMERPWSRVIRRAANYRFHGFSLQEWTAKKRDDGLIGMLDVASRPQVTIEKWDVTDTGQVLGVVQRSPQTHEELPIPRGKLVYMVDDALNDSPEGLGIFRHLAEPAERLQYFQFLEACSFETNLRGIPIVKAPLDDLEADGAKTQAQKLARVQPLIDLIMKRTHNKSQGVFIDSAVYEDADTQRPSSIPKWEVTLLEGPNRGGPDVAAAIERITREMARLMGVEHLLLGGDSRGTQALAKDKSLTFSLIVDSALTELADTFTRDWVRVIFILNGWDEKLMPTLKPDQQTRNVEEVTSALLDLSNSGAMIDQDDPIVDWVRDRFGVPNQLPPEEREEDDSTDGDGTGGGGGGGGGDPAGGDPNETRDVKPDDQNDSASS